MNKLCCLLLIVSLLCACPAFAQDINSAQLRRVTKIEPARASYLLPPQGQPATGTTPPTTGASSTSHKKRNIIIVVVVAAVAAGVIVAASNGGYGSSSNSGY